MQRKIILALLIIAISASVSANILIDVYNRNYGLIERTVLVFDSKPDYSIFTEKYSIWISLANCQKNIELKDKKFTDNPILSSFKYHQASTEVNFAIGVNSDVQKAKNYNFDFKILELQEDVFKLVFDVFATSIPSNSEEIQCFIDFYKKMGNSPLVNRYKQLQKDLLANKTIDYKTDQGFSKNKYEKYKPEMKTEEPLVDAQEKTEPSQLGKTQSETPDKSVQIFDRFGWKQTGPKAVINSFVSKYFWLIIIFILLNYAALAIILFLPKIRQYKFKKKKQSPTEEISVFRTLEGFGDKDFMKKVAKKLADLGWNNEEISKEINLDIFSLEKLKLSELSQKDHVQEDHIR